MRVLLTTDTVGGVWTFTKELTYQLLAQKHSVVLVSFGRLASPTQRAWAEALTVSCPNRFIFRACDAPLEWMQDNSTAWAQGVGLLMRVAEEYQVDILHSGQFCWGALPLAVPKLITVHSDVRSWAAAAGSGLPPSQWLDRYDALVQHGIDGADGLVAPTAWMRSAFVMNFKSPAPFHVIPNGRTLPQIDRQQRCHLRAISAGRRWDEGKGLSVLSEFASPMPILLAGEPCFEGVAAPDLPPNVVELGMLDQAQLFDLLSTSSIYLVTSLYEPFGLAPLEAALCGCAIVARDLPSLREVWGDGALYFIDASGLQDILARLSRDASALSSAGSAARQRAMSFSAKRMADSYTTLYRELIEAASSGILPDEKRQHAA